MGATLRIRVKPGSGTGPGLATSSATGSRKVDTTRRVSAAPAGPVSRPSRTSRRLAAAKSASNGKTSKLEPPVDLDSDSDSSLSEHSEIAAEIVVRIDDMDALNQAEEESSGMDEQPPAEQDHVPVIDTKTFLVADSDSDLSTISSSLSSLSDRSDLSPLPSYASSKATTPIEPDPPKLPEQISQETIDDLDDAPSEEDSLNTRENSLQIVSFQLIQENSSPKSNSKSTESQLRQPADEAEENIFPSIETPLAADLLAHDSTSPSLTVDAKPDSTETRSISTAKTLEPTEKSGEVSEISKVHQQPPTQPGRLSPMPQTETASTTAQSLQLLLHTLPATTVSVPELAQEPRPEPAPESAREVVPSATSPAATSREASAREAAQVVSQLPPRPPQRPQRVVVPAPPIPPNPTRPTARSRLRRRWPEHIRPRMAVPPSEPQWKFQTQCVEGAEHCRLNPFALHPEEHAMLRTQLSHGQVTTWLNLRNAICRMWMRNPRVPVSKDEALGCAKDSRWFDAANVCWQWLVRKGFINFGCVEIPRERRPEDEESYEEVEQVTQAGGSDSNSPQPLGRGARRTASGKAAKAPASNSTPASREYPPKRRQTVVVVGAGMSGLGCARQLEGLFRAHAPAFEAKGEDLPRVVVVEGRDRVGGRVWSRAFESAPSGKKPPSTMPHFRDGKRLTAEMGGMIITGFERGNPLNVLVRGQMGLGYHILRSDTTIYDTDGKPVDHDRDMLVERLFNDCLERVSEYKFKLTPAKLVEGNKDMIAEWRDSAAEAFKTIAYTEDAAAAAASLAERHSQEALPEKAAPAFGTEAAAGAAKPPTAPENSKAAERAKAMGWKLRPDVASSATVADLELDLTEAASAAGATLGSVLDAAVEQYKRLLPLAPLDFRLLNWHVANLEYSNAANLSQLSLGGWDLDAGNEWEGKHSMIVGGYQSVPRLLALSPFEMDLRLESPVRRIQYAADPEDVAAVSESITGGPRRAPRRGGPAACVELDDGTRIDADYVVSTLPLGVLKQPAGREGTVTFDPPLPGWKRGAIERLGFGLLNKVVLVYDKPFWPANRDIFGTLRGPDDKPILQTKDGIEIKGVWAGGPPATEASGTEQKDYAHSRGRFFQWFNVSATSGRPTLIALMAGDAAVDTDETGVWEDEIQEGEDAGDDGGEENGGVADQATKHERRRAKWQQGRLAGKRLAMVLVAEATRQLRRVYGEDKVPPRPVESVVTCWGKDRFSLGSYSSAGPNMLPDDYDTMARPVGRNLVFAGEHTCGTHPATVHGAYLSGLRAAAEVLDAMIGKIDMPVPLVLPKDGVTPSMSYAASLDAELLAPTYRRTASPAARSSPAATAPPKAPLRPTLKRKLSQLDTAAAGTAQPDGNVPKRRLAHFAPSAEFPVATGAATEHSPPLPPTTLPVQAAAPTLKRKLAELETAAGSDEPAGTRRRLDEPSTANGVAAPKVAVASTLPPPPPAPGHKRKADELDGGAALASDATASEQPPPVKRLRIKLITKSSVYAAAVVAATTNSGTAIPAPAPISPAPTLVPATSIPPPLLPRPEKQQQQELQPKEANARELQEEHVFGENAVFEAGTSQAAAQQPPKRQEQNGVRDSPRPPAIEKPESEKQEEQRKLEIKARCRERELEARVLALHKVAERPKAPHFQEAYIAAGLYTNKVRAQILATLGDARKSAESWEDLSKRGLDFDGVKKREAVQGDGPVAAEPPRTTVWSGPELKLPDFDSLGADYPTPGHANEVAGHLWHRGEPRQRAEFEIQADRGMVAWRDAFNAWMEEAAEWDRKTKELVARWKEEHPGELPPEKTASGTNGWNMIHEKNNNNHAAAALQRLPVKETSRVEKHTGSD